MARRHGCGHGGGLEDEDLASTVEMAGIYVPLKLSVKQMPRRQMIGIPR